MSTSLSAGVKTLETDITNVVAPVATSIAAYVGQAIWGPANLITLVTDEGDYANLFGKPTDVTYKDFYTVAGFLQYGQNMNFVRACNPATARNSTLVVDATGGAITGTPEFISDWTMITESFGSNDKFHFYAKYPGALGNSIIKIGLVNYTDWANRTSTGAITGDASEFSGLIEYGPGDASQYIVIVETLNTDGVTYSIVEQFLIDDQTGTIDTFGKNIYVNNLINTGSKWIIAFNNPNKVGTVAPSFGSKLLTGGNDGTTTGSDIINGYTLFSNTEAITINYLIGGANTQIISGLPTTISGLAVSRADCISIHDLEFSLNTTYNPTAPSISPNQSDSDNAQACVDYRNATGINTSYSAIYGNWFYIYDKYNDVNRWVPGGGFVAGIYALTADRNDAWFAPAGLNRAVISGVIKIAFNPKKVYRDKLYQSQVNPIVNFPGQGIVIWGQKTMQTKASAFDRVNVRLLFLFMEKAISQAAMFVVFEQNDSLTQAVFLNMVNPFMNDIKGRRGVTAFLVDVGPKVNTPTVIDNNEFRANILVQPTRAAEFITLNFVATKTGVDLTEVTV